VKRGDPQELEMQNEDTTTVLLIEEENSARRHWEDIFIEALFSVGGLFVSNMLVMVSMLYFSYSASPPSESDVEQCFGNISQLPKSCQRSFPGLRDYKQNSTALRVAVITAVGGPLAIFLVMNLLKPLGVTLRAHGLESCRGMMSTFMGLFVIVLFVMRGVYCFSPVKNITVSSMWACAKSEDTSYRVLNNTLIQLLLVMLCIFVLKLTSMWIRAESFVAFCQKAKQNVHVSFKEMSVARTKHFFVTKFSHIQPPEYVNEPIQN
jgi:hypothetical protein